MKKLIILIAALLAVSVLLVSCAKDETVSPNNQDVVENVTPDEIVTPDETVTPDEIVTPEETPVEDETPVAEGKTPAETLAEAFAEAAKAEGATAESVATALSTNAIIPFMAVAQMMEPGYLPGFNEEITDFEECYFVGPMIGSIPFVAYVFDIADDADSAAFVANLEALHNLRWNICVSAEQMLTAVEGDLVFFIMSPNSFEQEPDAGMAL